MSKLLRSVICGLVAVGLFVPTAGVAFADDGSPRKSDGGISAEEKRLIMSKLLRSVICGLVAVGLFVPTAGVAFADDGSPRKSDGGISAEEKRHTKEFEEETKLSGVQGGYAPKQAESMPNERYSGWPVIGGLLNRVFTTDKNLLNRVFTTDKNVGKMTFDKSGDVPEGDGTTIENIKVKWLSTADETLVKTPINNDGQTFGARVDFSLSGQHSYKPGDIEIKLPLNIFKDRFGKDEGALDMSLPEQTFGARVDFSLSGQHSYKPGDIEIKLPLNIFKDRFGKDEGALDMSLPEDPAKGAVFTYKRQHSYKPGDIEIKLPLNIFKDRFGKDEGALDMSLPEDPAKGAVFTYKRVDGTILVSNTRELPAGYQGYFEVYWDDVIPAEVVSNQLSAPFGAIITVVTNSGNTLQLTSNTINAMRKYSPMKS